MTWLCVVVYDTFKSREEGWNCIESEIEGWGCGNSGVWGGDMSNGDRGEEQLTDHCVCEFSEVYGDD